MEWDDHHEAIASWPTIAVFDWLEVRPNRGPVATAPTAADASGASRTVKARAATPGASAVYASCGAIRCPTRRIRQADCVSKEGSQPDVRPAATSGQYFAGAAGH